MCKPRDLRTRAVGSNGRQRSKPNMAPASDDFGSDGFLPNSGTNRLLQAMATDTSPDSKSPICLDRFENVAYLNRCYHRFCFRCVQEWSKNKVEWPLCKQPFHSIIHSSIVVHFMLPETREIYELEKLWTLRAYDDQLAQMVPESLPDDFIFGMPCEEQ